MDQTTIPTNLRLLAVLEEIAQAGGAITPTQLNERLHLPKPTIHRLFATLKAEGFIQPDLDGRGFIPAPRLSRLAQGVLASEHLRTGRQAILRALSDQIGETCNISVPDGDAMIYSERVETAWPLRIQLPTGTRVPLYSTASGKLYLSTLSDRQIDAYLDATELKQHTDKTLTSRRQLLDNIAQIRSLNYAVDDEEFMQDMVAIAVPILDRHNHLTATLSCHAPTQRFSTASLSDHLSALRNAAARIASLITDDSAAS